MKYQRLTKEQFEALHQEFANFLASQSIDKIEWEEIKSKRPQVAEQELDVFSDLIWEGTLNKVDYLESISKNHIFLFKFGPESGESIVLKTSNPEVDFLNTTPTSWILDHLQSTELEVLKGSKTYSDRNAQIFELIKQGATISKGELFEALYPKIA